MLGPRPHHVTTSPRRLAAAVAGASAVLLMLSACGAGTSTPNAGTIEQGGSVGTGGDSAGSPSPSPTPTVVLRTNVRPGATRVAVDTVLTARASDGTVSSVSVASKHAGTVGGKISADGRSWRADSLLEPGTAYTMTVSGVDGTGRTRTTHTHFTTQPLTLDQQTYPSVYPLAGQTVGVGMPVIVKFDVAVTDKAAFEKHMHVVTEPAQQGSWYWLSDHEAHWRPKTFWKAGTKVSVHLDLNSIPAGHGIYGQLSRDVNFTIGQRHIYKVNLSTDEMAVYSDGKLLRTIPVTGGKPGFTTRSGIKVIIEKDPSVEMNSETIGVGKNSPDYYDLKDVQWAMRMTYSGEFLHAAPWSVADQGHENVSHGCTGMSTANAAWLYHLSLPGDVVEETGTDRPMEFTNGYGDWNMSWADYQKGSAL